jgi:hypothetical protein
MSVTGIELLHGFNLNEQQISPEFFCIGVTSNPICHVSLNGGDYVTIYCDGDMRIIFEDESIYDCHQLVDMGVTTDADLNAIYDEENGSRIIMNPWFDIYDSNGDHLDMVGYDIWESIESAKTYLKEEELSNDKKTEV